MVCQTKHDFEDLGIASESRYMNASEDPLVINPSWLLRLRTQKQHLRECLAEFLGTFVMLVFGMGVNNQVINSGEKNGTFLSINIFWGIGVMLGAYCSLGISGAHLNSALTFRLAVHGRLPWWKAPGYVISQLLGAFAGAIVVWVMQWQNLNAVDSNRMTTQSSFATYPSDGISNYTAFFGEFVGTAVLVLSIFAISDQRNCSVGPVGAPFAYCLMIMGIGMAFDTSAVNPARDLGPRLFTFCAGWGSKVFTAHNYYFWVPIAGGLLGGVAGAGFYRLLVDIHHA